MYIRIAQNILTGNAASVTFSSIPQTYQHLMVRMSARSDSGADRDALLFAINGDTNAANYWRGSASRSNNTTSGDTGSASRTFPLSCTGGTAVANVFSATEITLSRYTQSVTKLLGFYASSTDSDSDSTLTIGSLIWPFNSAITSLTISPSSGGNFVAGTTVNLYGLG
jgi:hypothetical protein